MFFSFFSFFPWPTLFSTKFVRFQSIINIYIYKRKRKKKRRIISSTLELPEFGNLRDFQAKRIILIESRYININFSFPLDGLFREYALFFFSSARNFARFNFSRIIHFVHLSLSKHKRALFNRVAVLRGIMSLYIDVAIHSSG